MFTCRTLHAVALIAALAPASVGDAQTARNGTIKGHIKLMGHLPGNTVIRMGMDPMCATANQGSRVVQDIVHVTADGSLANVFIRLEGKLPAAPPPATPVVIDQRRCVYVPRVIGAQVGQILQVKNSDNLLHSVHSVSSRGNDFNISEPTMGMVQQFRLKNEEVMLRIKCDIHSWMTTYVGVVANPYFSVSRDDGTFSIPNVPPGSYTLVIWHERYGELRRPARVQAGGTTTVDLEFPGDEKPLPR